MVRRVRAFWDQLRRDLVIVAGDLRGRRLSPTLPARPSPAPARGMPSSAPDPGPILEERFVSPSATPRSVAEGQPMIVRDPGGAVLMEGGCRAGQTLLEAGLEAAVALPFSCAMGGCGACRVTLIEGTVEMETPNCLSAEERAEGLVLTCVGRATSPVVLALLAEGGDSP